MLRTLSRKISLPRHQNAKCSDLERLDDGPLTARMYWLSEKDVKQRSFWDWCEAHSSMSPPLHRFYGTVMLTKDGLYVQGADMKGGQDGRHRIDTVILPDQIVEVFRGFDKVFSRWEDRSAGIAFKPLRVKFRDETGEMQTWYCMLNFHSLSRSDDGKTWYETLQQWKDQPRAPARCQPMQYVWIADLLRAWVCGAQIQADGRVVRIVKSMLCRPQSPL